MASKSHGWDVRNIAKISPKMPKNAQKTVNFRFVFDFLTNCPYDSNEVFYSHSTPYYGPLCAISFNSHGWDVRNIAKFSPTMAKKQLFFDFSDFLTNCSYDSNESESEGKRLKPTPLRHMQLWCFLLGVGEKFRLYMKSSRLWAFVSPGFSMKI